jgi:uncharacterized protein (UPF0261 family)
MKEKRPGILVMGILDTKGEEIKFLADQIKVLGGNPIVMELTVSGKPVGWADISIDDVAKEEGLRGEDLSKIPRERAAEYIARGGSKIAKRLYQEGRINALISHAGSLGTSIATRIMRSLPYGPAKIMLSTMSSGDCRPYVDIKDIAMWYPVAEKGINAVTVKVIASAAGAVVGAAKAAVPIKKEKPLIGYTLFGTTTPCAISSSKYMEEKGYDSIFVHAVGSGGRSIEELIREGYIKGIIDITTHELTDLICGGVLSAGPERLTAAGEKGIPQVISTGGADMINFGPREGLKGAKSKITKRKFAAEEKEGLPGRKIYSHNPMVTVVGTLPEEARELAKVMAERLNKARGPTLLAVPMEGWSAYDIGKPALELGWSDPGPGPFWFSYPRRMEWGLRAAEFVDEIKKHINTRKENLAVILCDKHINEKNYAEFLARELLKMLEGRWKKGKYKDINWVIELKDFIYEA